MELYLFSNEVKFEYDETESYIIDKSGRKKLMKNPANLLYSIVNDSIKNGFCCFEEAYKAYGYSYPDDKMTVEKAIGRLNKKVGFLILHHQSNGKNDGYRINGDILQKDNPAATDAIETDYIDIYGIVPDWMKRITILSAPPGFGKSTLSSHWAREWVHEKKNRRVIAVNCISFSSVFESLGLRIESYDDSTPDKLMIKTLTGFKNNELLVILDNFASYFGKSDPDKGNLEKALFEVVMHFVSRKAGCRFIINTWLPETFFEASPIKGKYLFIPLRGIPAASINAVEKLLNFGAEEYTFSAKDVKEIAEHFQENGFISPAVVSAVRIYVNRHGGSWSDYYSDHIVSKGDFYSLENIIARLLEDDHSPDRIIFTAATFLGPESFTEDMLVKVALRLDEDGLFYADDIRRCFRSLVTDTAMFTYIPSIDRYMLYHCYQSAVRKVTNRGMQAQAVKAIAGELRKSLNTLQYFSARELESVSDHLSYIRGLMSYSEDFVYLFPDLLLHAAWYLIYIENNASEAASYYAYIERLSPKCEEDTVIKLFARLDQIYIASKFGTKLTDDDMSGLTNYDVEDVYQTVISAAEALPEYAQMLVGKLCYSCMEYMFRHYGRNEDYKIAGNTGMDFVRMGEGINFEIYGRSNRKFIKPGTLLSQKYLCLMEAKAEICAITARFYSRGGNAEAYEKAVTSCSAFIQADGTLSDLLNDLSRENSLADLLGQKGFYLTDENMLLGRMYNNLGVAMSENVPDGQTGIKRLINSLQLFNKALSTYTGADSFERYNTRLNIQFVYRQLGERIYKNAYEMDHEFTEALSKELNLIDSVPNDKNECAKLCFRESERELDKLDAASEKWAENCKPSYEDFAVDILQNRALLCYAVESYYRKQEDAPAEKLVEILDEGVSAICRAIDAAKRKDQALRESTFRRYCAQLLFNKYCITMERSDITEAKKQINACISLISKRSEPNAYKLANDVERSINKLYDQAGDPFEQ